MKFLDWMKGLLVKLRHGHIIPTGGATPPPPPPPPGVPAISIAPTLADVDGTTVTAPLSGSELFINPGTWTNTPTSYVYQLYDSGGAIIGCSGAYVSGEPIYTVLESDVGGPLHIGIVATNGVGPSSEALSSATSNVALPAITPPILARTSGSGVVPFAFTITFDSTVRAGMLAHLIVTNPDDASVLQDIYKEITQDELSGSFNSYWDGTYAPTPAPLLTLPTGTQEVRVEVVAVLPGSTISSGLSNAISPTDVSYGPQLLPAFTDASWVLGTNASLNVDGTVDCGLNGDMVRYPVSYTVGATYRAVLVVNKTGQAGNELRFDQTSAGGGDTKYTSGALPDGSNTISFNFVADANGWFNFSATAAYFIGTVISASLRKVL